MWVDVFWAWSVGIVGMSFLVTGNGALVPRVAAGVLLLLWSLRLGSHIFQRVSQETSEDGRYAAMREALGSKAQPVFLVFFWGQGLLAWGFALTFWVVGEQDLFTPPFVLLGVAIGLLAIAGEALADKQLSDFKKRPDSKGKTCREGFWRYSRHPNYFLRVAALGQLPGNRHRRPVRGVVVGVAVGHVRVPVVRHGHPLHREAGAQIPRR